MGWIYKVTLIIHKGCQSYRGQGTIVPAYFPSTLYPSGKKPDVLLQRWLQNVFLCH